MSFLNLRIKNLEKENGLLSQELSEIKIDKLNLMQKNFALEESVKGNDSKIQELNYIISAYQHKDDCLGNKDDNVSLEIEVTNLKADLKVKESLFSKLKEEMENLRAESREKISQLNRELYQMQEKTIKFDNLTVQLEREKANSQELNLIRQELNKSKLLIKEQEERIRILRSYDNNKEILLKEIERIKCELLQEKSIKEDLIRENKRQEEIIISMQFENQSLMKTIDEYKKIELDFENDIDNNNDQDNVINLSEKTKKREALLNHKKKLDSEIENHQSQFKALENIINDQSNKMIEDLKAKIDYLENKNKELMSEKINENKDNNEIKILKKEIERLKEEVLTITAQHEEELDNVSNIFHGYGVYSIQEMNKISNRSDISESLINYTTNPNEISSTKNRTDKKFSTLNTFKSVKYN